MTSMTIEVKGAAEADAKLKELGDNAKVEVPRIVEWAALVMVREAKIRSPIDTGRLRSSIQYEMTGPAEALVFDGVAYGVFQEYGTSRMRAHPFMRPAIDQVRYLGAARLEQAKISISRV